MYANSVLLAYMCMPIDVKLIDIHTIYYCCGTSHFIAVSANISELKGLGGSCGREERGSVPEEGGPGGPKEGDLIAGLMWEGRL